MSVFSAIETRVDLHSACDRLGVGRDARALITALYNEPLLSAEEAGMHLGWDSAKLRRVTRSLCSDRELGAGLRTFLGAYSKNKSDFCVVESTETAV